MHRSRWLVMGLAVVAMTLLVNRCGAQTTAARTADDLLALSDAELVELYSAPTSIAVSPTGRCVRGMLIMAPGEGRNRRLSRVGRVVWQGKSMEPEEGRIANWFFGVPVIRGELYEGTSRIDGRPSILIDYSRSSLLFRPYVDEFREVSPGLYLGFMYDTRSNPPERVRTFLLDDQ